jgi:hypothetical protein
LSTMQNTANKGRERGGRKKFLEKSIQPNKDTTAIICVGEPFTVRTNQIFQDWDEA